MFDTLFYKTNICREKCDKSNVDLTDAYGTLPNIYIYILDIYVCVNFQMKSGPQRLMIATDGKFICFTGMDKFNGCKTC